MDPCFSQSANARRSGALLWNARSPTNASGTRDRQCVGKASESVDYSGVWASCIDEAPTRNRSRGREARKKAIQSSPGRDRKAIASSTEGLYVRCGEPETIV